MTACRNIQRTMNVNTLRPVFRRFRARLTHLHRNEAGRRYRYDDLERTFGPLCPLSDRPQAQARRPRGGANGKTPRALFFYLGCLRQPDLSAAQHRLPSGRGSVFPGRRRATVYALRPKHTGYRARALATARGIEHVFTLDAQGHGTLPDACAGTAPEFAGYRPTTMSPSSSYTLRHHRQTPKGAMLTHGNACEQCQGAASKNLGLARR